MGFSEHGFRRTWVQTVWRAKADFAVAVQGPAISNIQNSWRQTPSTQAHRNTIRFNPFGSLVCLAGFGNLAGEIDVFGRLDDDRCDFVQVIRRATARGAGRPGHSSGMGARLRQSTLVACNAIPIRGRMGV